VVEQVSAQGARYSSRVDEEERVNAKNYIDGDKVGRCMLRVRGVW
jgi:hypothetical protein